MATPTDAAFIGLLAACEQLARSLRAVQQLTSAGLQGRSLSTAVLESYDAQAERAGADLDPFRVLIAQFKSQISVH